MKCRKCHIQYIEKTETPFNQRLNNHRSNAYRPKPDNIPVQTLQWQRPRLQQRCEVHIDRTNWELTNYCRETNNHFPERKLLDNHTANTDPSRF